ncbi:type IV pilus assembly protein FimV [Aestuariirhabdus litorea]|uniref:FimV N-terminal domain-containing protein n=1 Tax=Aestuariirhabdus litorea TaxID=2528527 RepID=A0A3P3VLQ1_9GAMM|nr:FimV/HubP family polar landmark protein [Aestuariirhabdus litorea]RRJ83550.1 hypothetical protein D0544_00020 [Aestuariirhabdus litorea]RWW96771.1 hypothetical protein DZC74_00020 [Endozoicomonadaceae bacterium GTF-13]
MLRQCSIAALCSTLLLSNPVLAMGVGQITVKSTLGSALWAEIELTTEESVEPREVIAKLAGREAFQRMGIARDQFLTQLKFELRTNNRGRPYLLVTSKDAVKEPFLNFVLDLQWSRGQLLREYAVLLDPPAETPTAPDAAGSSRPQETESIIAPAPPSTEHYQTRPGDSLWIIASRLRPSEQVSVRQTMQALHQMNPKAFINGNINLLKTNQRLKVPTQSDVMALNQNEARRYIATQISKGNQAIAALGTNAAPAVAASETRANEPPPPATPPREPAPLPPESGSDRLRLLSADEEQSLATQDIAQLKSTYNELMEEKAVLLRTILQQYEELEALKVKQQSLDQTLANERSSLPAVASLQAAGDSPQPSSSTNTTTRLEADANPNSNLVNIRVDQPPTALSSREVITHPAFLAAAATSLLLFIALIWLLIRRGINQRNETLTADTLITREKETNDTELAMPSREEPDEPIKKPVFRTPEPDPLRIEDDQLLEEEEDELDETIRAANIYLAYGRLREAKALIRDALAQDPDREDLKLTLLELHCKEENTEAFDQLAAELDGSPSEAVLQQLRELRRLMNRPLSNELSEPEEAVPDTLDEVLLTDEELGLNSEELDYFPPQESLTGLDLDLDSASEEEWHKIQSSKAAGKESKQKDPKG